MGTKSRVKLTTAEAARLEQFVDEHDGQEKAGALLGVSLETVCRTARRHTAPSTLFRKQLKKHGIVKA